MRNFVICLILFSRIVAQEGFIGSVPDPELANQVCYRENQECVVRLPIVNNFCLVIYGKIQEKEFRQLVQEASEPLGIPLSSVCLLDLFKANLEGEDSKDKYHAFNEKCEEIHTIFEKAERIAIIYEKSDVLTYYLKSNVDLSSSGYNFAKLFLHLYLTFHSHMSLFLNCSENSHEKRIQAHHDLKEYGLYRKYSLDEYANCFEFIDDLTEAKINRTIKDLLRMIKPFKPCHPLSQAALGGLV